ncbi:Flavin-dependent oxidoreductase, luciferase family (includes alkanesulfonate monooxygenase SsuD and methylene tetrahydromethanopterin reductase) [Micromonospora matsumotoense]|uniref:Flavin-dependent oxidoreductase, luciferase family (Includes alkanesulfonate monooxygenase SsuD and methylene tetrahydromethanopterin reductase) n=2 Tax=Micromonospora matsumotoense TaxID=121616 RepID=A0A1C4ZR33_9ACTN|nr:Flavin-dependent oxidoreductase, luciferase family (includes alkanesulfonate monooxygenase SsuD and methylene tetrahydromethanopterin reductase) [Micromonospora matsumotoense]
MLFSMTFEGQMADPADERSVLRHCVEQAVFAEQAGFDRVWAVEHHGLRWCAHMSAPEVFLSMVAAKTSRIRIGHGVVCLPFAVNHPIRAAERAAMLDLLSDGRLDLGVGRGATQVETSLFGVDPERTHAELDEGVRIIASAWKDEVLEWHGPLLDIGPRAILPRPVQLPHPPLFMACSRQETVELAAEYGVGALVMGFGGIEEVRKLRKVYDEAIATRSGSRLVSSSVNDHLAALCPTVVLEDGQRALEIGVRGQRFFAQSIGHYYMGRPRPDESVDPATGQLGRPDHDHDQARAMDRAREDQIAFLNEARIPADPTTLGVFNTDHAYGTPEQAIRYVEKLQEAGADEVICLIQMGTVPLDVCMETIRMWGEHVIPQFRR